MLDKITKEAVDLLSKHTKINKQEVLSTISTPKDEFGDLSSRICFILAKQKKENPAKIATEVAKKLKSKSFEKIVAIGPYINFYFSDETYAKLLNEVLKQKHKYGSGKKSKSKVMVEFPAVNPNKPWHIGHLRNALLGDSVARILEFSGSSIERIDYIDDLGLQVAQSLWGVLNLKRKPSGKFDLWLGEQYVDVAKAFKEDQKVEQKVRNYLHHIEEGSNEIAEHGRKLSEDCVKAQYETAFAFSVYHDALIFESNIMHELFEDGLKMLKANNAIVHETEGKNKGCWVVRLSEEFEHEFGKMKDPDKILIRSDGTATYTGKDVIFHLWKFGKLKKKLKYLPFVKQPNGKTAFKSVNKGKEMSFGNTKTVINVIGQEQKYPQRVVKEVLKRLGFDTAAENLAHLAYEHVGLPDAKFSGRAGTWVGYTADELLSEAKQRVTEKIKGELTDNEKQIVVASVGAGAIKFAFLRTSAEKKITFKWDEALNMEGDSGPYAQYAYVRTLGILKKTKEKSSVAKNYSFNNQEKSLLKRIAAFSQIVKRSAREFAPHHLCQYVLDVAGDFSGFYSSSPVLKAEKQTMKSRLAIVLATNYVLGNTLNLLGIEKPEKM